MFGLKKQERKRLRVIAGAMAKYGFDSVVNRLHLKARLPVMERLLIRWKVLRPEKSPAVRFREMIEELGTTFIKLGQVLSLRRDALPDEFIAELEKLQDNVPPVPVETVKSRIRRELGRPVEELFAAFEERPLAAASIAQVHTAVLSDGREVVVKLQRPGIEERIRLDLHLLGYIARLLVRYIPESRLYDPPGQVEELTKTILKELDFETERRHTERFRENFSNSGDIVIPGVVASLSGKKVLTMEMSRGRKINELYDDDIRFRKRVARRLIDSYLKQVFRDGFFHADPHPGNIFVLEDGRLCFHDFGMMGHLNPEMRDNLADWFLAFIDRDIDGVADVYLRIGITGQDFDRRAFKRSMGAFMEEYYNLPLKDFSLASIIEQSIKIGRTHGIRVSSDLLMLGKAFMTVEPVVRSLDPDFNLVESMRPYAMTIIKDRLSPSKVAKEGMKFMLDFQRVLREAPKALEVILHNARESRGELRIKHEKLEDLESHIDRSSNRLAFAIVVASIVIGSSYIAQYHIGPSIWGFSALGIIGYSLAGILGLRLVWAIIKAGKL